MFHLLLQWLTLTFQQHEYFSLPSNAPVEPQHSWNLAFPLQKKWVTNVKGQVFWKNYLNLLISLHHNSWRIWSSTSVEISWITWFERVGGWMGNSFSEKGKYIILSPMAWHSSYLFMNFHVISIISNKCFSIWTNKSWPTSCQGQECMYVDLLFRARGCSTSQGVR